MKTLYLLCGLSFSGKTTLARKIVERRRLLRSPPPSQLSDHGGHRWRLRSGGAQAGMVRSDRGRKRRRSFGGKMVSVRLTASTKTDRDLREIWDGRKSGRQETAGAAYR